MPSPRRSPARRIGQTLGLVLAVLFVLLALAAGSLALYLSRADLRPLAERMASDALGRRVTMGGLDVRWGNPLGIEIADLAIANASWGSRPDMIRIGRFAALVDLGPLLGGALHYRRLRISDAFITLERDAKGVGNWKFGAGTRGLALVPTTRGEFPTLVDFIGDRGLITYRTRGGDHLRIQLDRVAISSPGAETPARLLAEGAYNDVPARLDATTDSYAVLRDHDEPFGARFTLRGRDTEIAFNGRLWQPLDFDGARGELSIDARTLGELLRAMGVDSGVAMPVSAAGVLRRDGDDWVLAAAKGQVKRSGFSGSLALHEGGAGAPDDVDLDLDFGTLDVDDIAASFGGGEGGLAAVPLRLGTASGINVTAELTALRARVGGRDWNAAAMRGRLAHGEATLKELSFALGGGTLAMAGTLSGTGKNGQLDLQARLSKASITEIARELGFAADEIRGRLDGRATLTMAGATLGAAFARSDGAAVVTLRDGTIARSLVERLSTDLRSLFRSEEGSVPVACLLAVLTVRNGLGVLSPLRLESHAAIVTGAGKIDFAHAKLDLTLRTESDSTGFFALDIPVRISGPVDALAVDPLVGSDEDWLKQPAAAMRTLPPELHDMAHGSACRA
jgi:hypothetical protein